MNPKGRTVRNSKLQIWGNLKKKLSDLTQTCTNSLQRLTKEKLLLMLKLQLDPMLIPLFSPILAG